MAGTLSATIAPAIIAVPRNAALTGSGAFDVASMLPRFATASAFTGAGALTGSAIARYAGSAAFTGAGALTGTASTRYLSAAGLAAAGALSATATKVITAVTFSDNFNRADNSTTLGSNWLTKVGTMGIISNAAAPVDTSSDYSAAVYDPDLMTPPWGSNFDIETSILLGGSSEDTGLFFWSTSLNVAVWNGGGAAEGERVELSVVRDPSGNWGLQLDYYPDWPSNPVNGGGELLASNFYSSDAFSLSDKFTLRRITDEDTLNTTYYAVVNNSARAELMYIDYGQALITAQDNVHNGVSIGGYGLGGFFYQSIDYWETKSGVVAPLKPPDRLSGEGTLEATAVKWFEQSTEVNTLRINAPVPNCTGAWVTLIGTGGGGGSGCKGASASSRGGGGGGGGGAFIPRVFIPKASLGSTYSVNPPTAPGGGAARTTNQAGAVGGSGGTANFLSGATGMYAGGGIGGAGGLASTNAATGGTAGTVTGATGVAGAAGGNGGVTVQTAGTNNGASNSGGAGGGGAGGTNTSNAGQAGKAGGSANGQAGGTAGAVGAVGGPGSALTAGVAGSGGGGAGAGAVAGGAAPGYGGGAGGGGGSATGNSGAGGTGSPGFTKIEWV